jgi:hypothetical protein
MKLESGHLELAALLARLFGKSPAFVVGRAAETLIKLGAKAHRLAEDECNRPEKSEGEFERRERRIVKGARAVLDDLAQGMPIRFRAVGIEVTHDPRGYCLHLFHPEIGHNTWGGKESGYGI